MWPEEKIENSTVAFFVNLSKGAEHNLKCVEFKIWQHIFFKNFRIWILVISILAPRELLNNQKGYGRLWRSLYHYWCKTEVLRIQISNIFTLTNTFSFMAWQLHIKRPREPKETTFSLFFWALITYFLWKFEIHTFQG